MAIVQGGTFSSVQQLEEYLPYSGVQPGQLYEVLLAPSPSQLDSTMGATAPTPVFVFITPDAAATMEVHMSYTGECSSRSCSCVRLSSSNVITPNTPCHVAGAVFALGAVTTRTGSGGDADQRGYQTSHASNNQHHGSTNPYTVPMQSNSINRAAGGGGDDDDPQRPVDLPRSHTAGALCYDCGDSYDTAHSHGMYTAYGCVVCINPPVARQHPKVTTYVWHVLLYALQCLPGA